MSSFLKEYKEIALVRVSLHSVGQEPFDMSPTSLYQWLTDIQTVIFDKTGANIKFDESVYKNTVYRQLPETFDSSKKTVAPFKALEIESDLYARMLVRSLNVDGVASADFTYFVLSEEDGLLPGLLPSQIKYKYGVSVTFTIRTLSGETFIKTFQVDPIPSPKNIDRTTFLLLEELGKIIESSI